MHPKDLKYSPEHLWLKEEGDGRFRLGITYRYQEQLKSVVYLDLPRSGAALKRGQPFGAIESSKISTDLIMPISGSVIEANAAVIEKPGLVNKDPYGAGWLMVIQPGAANELKKLWSADQYLAATADNDGERPCQT